MNGKKMTLNWVDFPEEFPKFSLDPSGCTLSIRKIDEGVYALLSSIPNVDNAGFVVGEKG